MSHRSFFPYQTSYAPPPPAPSSSITSLKPVTSLEAGQFLDNFLANTLSTLYSHSSAGDSTLFHIGRMRDNLLGRVEKPSPPPWDKVEDVDEVKIGEGLDDPAPLDELAETDVPSQSKDQTDKLSKKEARKREREEKKARRRSERNEGLVSSLKGNESGDVKRDRTEQEDIDSIEEDSANVEIIGTGRKPQKRLGEGRHEKLSSKRRERERKKEKSKSKHADRNRESN